MNKIVIGAFVNYTLVSILFLAGWVALTSLLTLIVMLYNHANIYQMLFISSLSFYTTILGLVIIHISPEIYNCIIYDLLFPLCTWIITYS